MSDLAGCFSHNTDHWRTPTEIYNFFMSEGYIDPCPFHADFNGLERFYNNQKIYINPPYSQIKLWVDYALKLLGGGCKIVMLIPSRTETKYFHKLMEQNPKILFFKGRLHFNESKNSAPFPSCLIILEQGRTIKEYDSITDIKELKERGC